MTYEFVIFKNKHTELPVFSYLKNGGPVNLILAELTFAVVKEKVDTIPLFTRQNTAAGGSDDEIEFETNGINGRYIVHLIPENTEDLEEGIYWYQINVLIDNKEYIIKEGKIYIGETFI